MLEAVEGCRLSLGCNIVLQYTLQGLFHPSRRVRDVYWKIYNAMYISSASAMVAAYPELPGYSRVELSYAF